MNILVTGADGYVGWPFFISLAKKYFSKKVKIIGLDNLQRRSLVKKIRSNSAIKIATFSQRQKFINNLNKNVFLLKQDVANFDNVNKFIKKYKFKYIFNLAAQPSAPYSFLGANETNFTQNNNNQIPRNIIWSIKENKLQKKTKLIHSTTTGVYGSPKIKIPEGTQSGKILRLKEKGLPSVQAYGKGDQLIHVNIWTPKKLTSEERDLLEKMKTMENFSPNPGKSEKGFFEKMKDYFN